MEEIGSLLISHLFSHKCFKLPADIVYVDQDRSWINPYLVVPHPAGQKCSWRPPKSANHWTWEASEMAGRLGRHGLSRKNNSNSSGHKDILLAISCQCSSSCCIPWANEQRSATVQHWDLTSFMSTGHKHPITHSGICQISQGGSLITSFKWTYDSYKIYKYIGSKPQITHLFQAIHFRAKTSTTPFL